MTTTKKEFKDSLHAVFWCASNCESGELQGKYTLPRGSVHWTHKATEAGGLGRREGQKERERTGRNVDECRRSRRRRRRMRMVGSAGMEEDTCITRHTRVLTIIPPYQKINSKQRERNAQGGAATIECGKMGRWEDFKKAI